MRKLSILIPVLLLAVSLACEDNRETDFAYPTDVMASDGTYGNRIHVSWAGVKTEDTNNDGIDDKGVSSYVVERDAGSGWQDLATTSSTWIDDYAITPSFVYSYRVYGIDLNGFPTITSSPDDGYAVTVDPLVIRSSEALAVSNPVQISSGTANPAWFDFRLNAGWTYHFASDANTYDLALFKDDTITDGVTGWTLDASGANLILTWHCPTSGKYRIQASHAGPALIWAWYD